MKLSKKYFAVIAVSMWASGSQAALINTFEAVGDEAADIQQTVDDFRNALGANNGNLPVNADPNGRKQINWDGIPDNFSDPNFLPGDFFNFNTPGRARGIEFQATGTTTGFVVSSTEASGQPTEFGFQNDFSVFSEERLFTSVGGSSFDILFFDPSDQTTQATVSGFGTVFTGLQKSSPVELAFFNLAGELIGNLDPIGTASGNGLSFFGAIFDTPEIARISVLGDTRFFVENGLFGGVNGDDFAFDDFIFGEPIPVEKVELPAPASITLLLMGLIGFSAIRRRKAVR
jgi:hypothetical protein